MGYLTCFSIFLSPDKICAIHRLFYLPFQQLDYRVIILILMGKCTVRAVLDPSAIPLDKSGIARTMLPQIQRAIAKQAVEIIHSLMTGKIFTISILKKTIRIFHMTPVPILSYICPPSPPNFLQMQDWTDNTNAETRKTTSHSLSYRNMFVLSRVSRQLHPLRCRYFHSSETHAL